MSTETIALLTILRDETQSRDVHKRCDAEIARMAPKPWYMDEDLERELIKAVDRTESDYQGAINRLSAEELIAFAKG